MSFSAFFIGPPVPRGVFGGSMAYFMLSPCLGIRWFFMWNAVSALTANIASLTLLLASLSKIHCSSILLTMGKRILGLVQLSGLSLVPDPPARIKAFS
jgi:hypothetical protein